MSHAVNTFNRPVIIVRSRDDRGIVARVPADSLDEGDVLAQVSRIRNGFPDSHFEIDQSQVYYARQGLLGAA